MKSNATAIANYFVDLAQRDNIKLKQLGLMKRVYITHGFYLAIFDRSALDERFDTVEAWKNGPVIPSVYHSFKYNRDNSITEKAIIVRVKKDTITFEEPVLENDTIKAIAEKVWKRYEGFNDFELVDLLHRPGTPWAFCYEEGKSNEIPDFYTKAYYKKVINA